MITAYLDINHAEKLITATMKSVFEIHPTQWFCGNPSSLKMFLAGTITPEEGERLYLKLDVFNKNYGYEIILKFNNHVLQGYNTTVLNEKVTNVDQGYYSCKITTKFGASNCGSVLVKVFEKIKFAVEPNDARGYLYSSQKLFLTCAVSNGTVNGTFAWYYRKF